MRYKTSCLFTLIDWASVEIRSFLTIFIPEAKNDLDSKMAQTLYYKEIQFTAHSP